MKRFMLVSLMSCLLVGQVSCDWKSNTLAYFQGLDISSDWKANAQDFTKGICYGGATTGLATAGGDIALRVGAHLTAFSSLYIPLLRAEMSDPYRSMSYTGVYPELELRVRDFIGISAWLTNMYKGASTLCNLLKTDTEITKSEAMFAAGRMIGSTAAACVLGCTKVVKKVWESDIYK